ncbi:hypothetical protein OPQ81_008480 [Rhizoctonia solani]|nr:hypothetical protein OPQ81_008480 [Rhizoctonia solani]
MLPPHLDPLAPPEYCSPPAPSGHSCKQKRRPTLVVAYLRLKQEMSRSLRSSTGCTLCKTRRKKCDETKPQCLRCLASGRPCRYEYVRHPRSDGRRPKRTQPPPCSAPEGSAIGTQNVSAGLVDATAGSCFMPPISGESTAVPYSNVLGTSSNEICPNSNVVVPRGSVNPIFQPSAFPFHPWQQLPVLDLTSSSLASPDPALLTAGVIPVTTSLTPQELTMPWYKSEYQDQASDPEGVRPLLCTVLTLDKNVKDNTLPFVLHCYSQWAIARVFEPLKIAHAMREQVISQFSSKNTRTRTILIANVMDIFAKKLAIDGARKFILDQLVSDALTSGSSFMAETPSEPSLDRFNAMRTLGNMLETFALQIFTQPLAVCIQTLDCAAPIFRRACSEPAGQLVNLPNILLESNINLPYFANLDIIQSVTTGRPTYFQYEVPFSLELCEHVYRLQDSGLQWHLGFPVQFVLLFAWINSLCETSETSNNSQLVAWIETNLPQIKVVIDESGDPLLRIGRMVVLECWRSAVLIYLYMVLCKADAQDPRVIKAHRGFMRLVRGVKPRRNPDAHLSPPMVIAGVVTTKERDRETLRQRILGVQEFREQGTVGNDYMLQLEDVWARTRDEGRPAVWYDLRIACFRITGR